jgi:aspartyl-tRNA(Asn)/glutamyl-tRNA(Gln) amidotransferase subunit C
VLNIEDVKNIANLARIGITDEEAKKYQKDLSAILDWASELKTADVSGVEPTAHIIGMKNVWREDQVGDFGEVGEIRKLFPEEKNGYDKVKSVM